MSGVEKKPIISWLKSPKINADAVVSVPFVRSDGTLLVTAKLKLKTLVNKHKTKKYDYSLSQFVSAFGSWVESLL